MINKYREEITIGIISLIAFIVGFIAVGFIKSFLIIGIADMIYVGSIIMGKKKKVNTKTNKQSSKQNSSKKKKIVINIIKGIVIL